ncbi:MAG: hypothetical protein H8E34_00885 [Bacteroidetes bacterium]|nr:hypothetical protein [Bacteroidota bacterium]
MKKYLCIILIVALSLPAIAQRLKVKTYGNTTHYKKHYSHIIKAATINDSAHIFIAGNFTDKLTENDEVSGHKIYDTTLIVNKRGYLSSGDNILLTDFTVIPATEFQYGTGTGVYYPDGPDEEGYPFLGFYNRYTFEIDSLVYFNLSYAGVEQSHATGLRIKYSRDEGAYYICGVMADKRFTDINLSDIDAKSKGFILKVEDDGALLYSALVFSPDSVESDEEICVISDIAINDDETKIAFTGLNTIADFDGNHQPMTGVIDMDLDIEWCKSYEIANATYAGVDVLFNEDDTTLFVLHNSTGNEFSIVELDDAGAVLQGPQAYKFTGSETRNDTTRAHMMHYFNDTIIITGNHFAEDASINPTEYQYLYRIDLNADSLKEALSDFTHYSYQKVPVGNQKAVYSYWTPENSVYMDDNLYMVGVYNEYTTNWGFKYVSVDSIASSCVDTLGLIATEPRLNDTISCDGEIVTCTLTDVEVDIDDAYVIDTLECVIRGKSSIAVINNFNNPDQIWMFERINNDGIYAYPHYQPHLVA